MPGYQQRKARKARDEEFEWLERRVEVFEQQFLNWESRRAALDALTSDAGERTDIQDVKADLVARVRAALGI